MFYLVLILFALAASIGLFILKNRLINYNTPQTVIKLHGFLNGLIIIYTIIAYETWQVYPAIMLSTTAIPIIKAILVITLLIGNYLGGRLIYQYHIGLTSKTNKL